MNGDVALVVLKDSHLFPLLSLLMTPFPILYSVVQSHRGMSDQKYRDGYTWLSHTFAQTSGASDVAGFNQYPCQDKSDGAFNIDKLQSKTRAAIV